MDAATGSAAMVTNADSNATVEVSCDGGEAVLSAEDGAETAAPLFIAIAVCNVALVAVENATAGDDDA